jgi:SAM-dependent methyltransferase
MTANQPGKSRDLSRSDERVHVYRAQWSFERLSQMIREGDRVLNLGAGDCRLDQRLARDHQCDVVSLDVDDYNETDLPLLLYDGLHIPFPDDSFDVVLLIFALHHAEDPAAVLREARRVCRRHVIAFEDVLISLADRLIFRGFPPLPQVVTGLSAPPARMAPATVVRTGQRHRACRNSPKGHRANLWLPRFTPHGFCLGKNRRRRSHALSTGNTRGKPALGRLPVVAVRRSLVERHDVVTPPAGMEPAKKEKVDQAWVLDEGGQSRLLERRFHVVAVHAHEAFEELRGSTGDP